jgi:hypothetical protein
VSVVLVVRAHAMLLSITVLIVAVRVPPLADVHALSITVVVVVMLAP